MNIFKFLFKGVFMSAQEKKFKDAHDAKQRRLLIENDSKRDAIFNHPTY